MAYSLVENTLNLGRVITHHRGISCHGVLEDCNLLNKDFHDQSVVTFKKYYAIESDPHIAYEAKYQHMMEWAKASQYLLVSKSGWRLII